MVTSPNDQPQAQSGAPSRIDDFRSLLAAVPPAKAESLKERVYDWLEQRERDAEAAIEKAKARAKIVEEQNRIVRMELQGVEEDRWRAEVSTARATREGLFAEAMSALNAPKPAAAKNEEETAEEEEEEQIELPVEYVQPTDSSATTHQLQPMGIEIARKVHSADPMAIDIVIKELLDEVMQLREGASANVARILELEDEVQIARNEAETQRVLLNETLNNKDEQQNLWASSAQQTSWGSSAQRTSWAPAPTFRHDPPWRPEAARRRFDSLDSPDSPTFQYGDTRRDSSIDPDRDLWRTVDVKLDRIPGIVSNPDPPLRGYLDEDSENEIDIQALQQFDECYAKYAEMMLMLQLKRMDEKIDDVEIPWPILPDTPEAAYPVPRWKARFAEQEHVERFVKGFSASEHAKVWRGCMKDDWLDLLDYPLEENVLEIVQRIVAHLP